MTSTTVVNSNFQIILLDDDDIFRLGLVTLLESAEFNEIEIVSEGKLTEAISILRDHQADLLIISLDLATYPQKINTLLSIASNLEKNYPNLPLLILTPWGTNSIIENINNVKGCCGRNLPINELVAIIKTCARGETYFASTNIQPQSANVGGWLYRQGQFGLQEIGKNIAEINQILSQPLSTTDLIYWSGRRRELKLARWLIKQVLPTNPYSVNNNISSQENSAFSPTQNNPNSKPRNQVNLIKKSSGSDLLLSPSELNNVYDLTLAKIQSSVKNCTKLILEIDVLQEEKKKELLIIILNELANLTQELNYLELDQEQLKARKDIILKDLWQNSTIKFLNRHYSLPTNEYSLVDLILQQAPLVLEENSQKIVFLTELLEYEVLQLDLKIDNQNYTYESESAQELEEILLQNLIINVANIIMQFILNQFPDEQTIKHNLFASEWKSSRKIAMFRNNLVWEYRKEKYWKIPKNVFEDQFTMFKLAYQGIVLCTITHPRNQELKKMKGLPWAVTMVIEFRDSVSRSVKAIGDVVGKTVVYLLTDVIGKGIGLIGKGVLQGIGSKIKN